jgi:hypothetical protein
MQLSTKFLLYRGDQFYWRRKPEDPEKTTDKLDHIMYKKYTLLPERESNPQQFSVGTDHFTRKVYVRLFFVSKIIIF